MASNNNHSKYIYRGFCEIILLLLATGAFFNEWYWFVIHHNTTGKLLGLGNLGMSTGLYALMYLFIGKALGTFRIGVDRKMKLLASQVMTIFCVNFVDVFISLAITGQFRYLFVFSGKYFIMGLYQSVVLCFVVIILVNIYRKIYPPFNLLEVRGEYENKLVYKIKNRPDKYRVIDSVDYRLGLDVLMDKASNLDGILVNDIPAEEKNKIIKLCFENDKRLYFVPKLSDIIMKNSEIINLFDTPLYLCRNDGMPTWKLALKRTFDIILSFLSFIILSPIFVVVAIAIKLDDKGPVFYKQERVTIGGNKFMILKFRSMIVDAEKDNRPHPAEEKDTRITRVGRIIRATRVDELPQLLNILKGEMSIVGPRPERVEHVEKYTKDISEFVFRNKVKGGLTGYAQVYGKYNTSALDKLKMDMIYISNYSLLMDLQILFETVKILFQKESTEGFTEDEVNKFN